MGIKKKEFKNGEAQKEDSDRKKSGMCLNHAKDKKKNKKQGKRGGGREGVERVASEPLQEEKKSSSRLGWYRRIRR